MYLLWYPETNKVKLFGSCEGELHVLFTVNLTNEQEKKIRERLPEMVKSALDKTLDDIRDVIREESF